MQTRFRSACGNELNRETLKVIFIDVIYIILAYLAVDFTFFREEGILSGRAAAALEACLLAAVLGIDYAYRTFRARPAGKRARMKALAVEAASFVLLFMVAPYKFLHLQTQKGYSNLWYSMDWHRFWMNWILVFKTSPVFFIVFAAALAAVIRAKMTNRIAARILIPALLLACYGFMWFEGNALVDWEQRNLEVFALPLAPAFALSLFRFNRAFSRMFIAGAMFSLVGFFYFGFLPARYWFGAPAYPAYIERLYPAEHGKSAVSLMFTRTMFVTRDNRHVYLSYGATCGLLDIDTERKELGGNIKVRGMMRKIWSRNDTNYIFGFDDLYSDFHVFSKAPFRNVKVTDMFSKYGLVSPLWFDMSSDMRNLYVITNENSEIIRYKLSGFDLNLERHLNLKKAGLTDFSSGGYVIINDEKAGSLFVLFGIVSWKMDYIVSEHDADTLELKHEIRLPEAGLFLEYSPQTRSIFSSSFYGRNLYEIDRDTFRLRRVIKGPLSSRSVVYDGARGLLYSGSYAEGDVQIIDYKTGSLLKRIFIGPKVTTLTLSDDNRYLYIASGFGLFRLDLDRMNDIHRPNT